MDLKHIKKISDQYIASTYIRKEVAFVRGKGSWLTDSDGQKYLDFFPGWGVSNIGHCHPKVVQAVTKQAKELFHLANVFYNNPQAQLAKKLIQKSFSGRAFFCNSGAEALEGALKAVKAYGKQNGKNEIIAFESSFHGRTHGALSLTGQKKYRQPFNPLIAGIKYAKLNDLKSFEKLVSDKTAGVFVELVQGEGGVNICQKDFVKELRSLADKHKFLLVFDEVQTGFGRTGKFFAFQNYNIKPDILCLAKAMGNGYPIGATLFRKPFDMILQPGMHASTFGGNHLGCQASLAVMNAFEDEKILVNMKPKIKKFLSFFKKMKKQYAKEIIDIRHLGMMFGIELQGQLAAKIEQLSFEKKLIINCTASNVLRIMPALNISDKDIDKGLIRLEECFQNAIIK